MNELRITLISRNGDGGIVPPRTKKNHGQIITVRGRPMMLPSPEYRAWEAGCGRASIFDRTAPPITWPVNCAAQIFRHANIGDAVGYYQAIADVLEVLGVVENDRLIVSWDGTRMLKDAADPRVEVLLTPAAGAQFDLLSGIPLEPKKARTLGMNARMRK